MAPIELRSRFLTAAALLGYNEENERYGHLEHLRRHAQVWPGTGLVGSIQHGWQPTWVDNYLPYNPLTWPFPQFVWSDVEEKRGRAYGEDRVAAIGSPWLYMRMHVERFPTPSLLPTGSETFSLLIPQHTVSWTRLAGGRQEVKQLLSKMTGAASHTPLVCLYWRDYLDDQWQEACRSLGLDAVTAGRPVAWPQFGSRPTFLERLHTIISGSSEVVVNDHVSAMIYAADLRKPVKIVDFFARVQVTSANYASWQHHQGELGRFRDELFAWWSSLQDVDHAHEVAQVELGANILLSPEMMRERFGWVGASGWFKSRYDAALNLVRTRGSRRYLQEN